MSNNFWGGGGQQVKGQKVVKELEKKSSQTPITCESKQVGPSNLSSTRILMRVKNIYSEYLHVMPLGVKGQISKHVVWAITID